MVERMIDMPTHGSTDPLTLMFSVDGGETFQSVWSLTEMEESTDFTTTADSDDEQPLHALSNQEMTFTGKAIVNRNTIYFVMGLRHLCDNNWLKMRGLPMKRRYWHGRRHKRRRKE